MSLIVVALAIWHYQGLAQQAIGAKRTLNDARVKAAAPGGQQVSPAELHTDFQYSHEQLGSLEASLDHDPLFWLAKRLPWLGPQAKAGQRVLDAGYAVSDAGLRATSLSQRLLEPSGLPAGAAWTQRLYAVLKTDPQDTQAISQDLQTAGSALASVDPDSMPLLRPLLPADFDTLRTDLRKTAAMASASNALVAALGDTEPKTYLLLGLDNTELLPAGGLIGVYGLVTLDHGAAGNIEFKGSGDIGYDWMAQHGLYEPPPAPLARTLMHGVGWDLATADWSPDFATSAAQAQKFVQQATGRRIDGVAALDLNGFQQLVTVVGGVNAPQYQAAIAPDDPIERLNELMFEKTPPGQTPYAVPTALASNLFDKLHSLPPDRVPALAQALAGLGQSGHLQVYATDSTLEGAARAAGLAGGMGSATQDHLAVVDANVMSTKLNLTLKERIAVHVDLHANGTATDTVTVTYTNDDRAWAQGKDAGLVSGLMCAVVCFPGTLGGFYGDYVRVYVPTGSRLRQALANGAPLTIDQTPDEPGKATFGAFVGVAQWHSLTLRLVYDTPAVVRPCGHSVCYRLDVRRQAGTDGLPVEVSWSLPPGDGVVAAALDGRQQTAAPNRIVTDLRQDRDILVNYEPKH